MLTFSNPRIFAVIEDWPLGNGKRGPCTFQVCRTKRGWRISRTTTGKPKYTTFGGPACIVDGNDGKTYLLRDAGVGFSHVTVSRGDLYDATAEMGGNASVFATTDYAAYVTLRELLRKSGAEEIPL